ncbi:hypothetical protein LY76DRAFT_243567 [Colletotrichum caudatum]|nr:hypothetical protein LY76DRAFT_243567 [Colletotrichum caudatum]
MLEEGPELLLEARQATLVVLHRQWPVSTCCFDVSSLLARPCHGQQTDRHKPVRVLFQVVSGELQHADSLLASMIEFVQLLACLLPPLYLACWCCHSSGSLPDCPATCRSRSGDWSAPGRAVSSFLRCTNLRNRSGDSVLNDPLSICLYVLDPTRVFRWACQMLRGAERSIIPT